MPTIDQGGRFPTPSASNSATLFHTATEGALNSSVSRLVFVGSAAWLPAAAGSSLSSVVPSLLADAAAEGLASDFAAACALGSNGGVPHDDGIDRHAHQHADQNAEQLGDRLLSGVGPDEVAGL